MQCTFAIRHNIIDLSLCCCLFTSDLVYFTSICQSSFFLTQGFSVMVECCLCGEKKKKSFFLRRSLFHSLHVKVDLCAVLPENFVSGITDKEISF